MKVRLAEIQRFEI